jgi:hypothetical protein
MPSTRRKGAGPSLSNQKLRLLRKFDFFVPFDLDMGKQKSPDEEEAFTS